MAIYSAAFAGTAVSAAVDIFNGRAPARTRLRLREIRVGQYSDFGDAAAEILGMTLRRGFDIDATPATTVTPVNLSGVTGNLACDTGIVIGVTDTGLTGDTGGATNSELLISDVMNIAAGWWYYPPEEECPIIEADENFALRVTAPADAITMSGTLIFETIGKPGN